MSHQKIVGLEGAQSAYVLRTGRILEVLVRFVHCFLGFRLGISRQAFPYREAVKESNSALSFVMDQAH